MSISAAMTNAVLGLRAAGRGAEVVSHNISNALTPGYARRSLDLTSAYGGGVQIAGVTRHVDAGLASDRRLADAEHQHHGLKSAFQTRFSDLLGAPSDPTSLASQLSDFEAALISATSRPDAPDRLDIVATEGRALARQIRAASDDIQAARSQADNAIATEVQTLNNALQQVQSLNAQITGAQARSEETAGLEDQRHQVIDQISTMVPVRLYQREGGQVALYSVGGAVLVEGSAATVGFEGVNQVTAYMSASGGHLSGLTVNGQPVTADGAGGSLGGGSIGAHFAVRDSLGPDAQAQLDVYARDLIQRFQDPAVDPSLAAGDAGLFTDEGGAFAAANLTGIAARISLNPAVDPAEGGEAWRLRDGINAATEGAVGNSTLLQALTGALNSDRPTIGGPFDGNGNSSSSLLSNISSSVNVKLANSDQQLSFAAARLTELTDRQLADGVDTDTELQRLIQVEQAYAANARMLEVLDDLMSILNRL